MKHYGEISFRVSLFCCIIIEKGWKNSSVECIIISGVFCIFYTYIDEGFKMKKSYLYAGITVIIRATVAAVVKLVLIVGGILLQSVQIKKIKPKEVL